jgi:hypothetical protein
VDARRGGCSVTALRHQILDDDRVLVTVSGDVPAHFRVSVAEAKRFAWSMLADLDPEGAEEAGYVAAAPVPFPARSHEDKDRATWGTQIEAIIGFLKTVPHADTNEISRAIGVNRQQCAVQLCRMRDRGHVACLRRGVAGIPAVWSVGAVSVEQWRLRNVRWMERAA